MKCLLRHCHTEMAQLTALTLIVGVGWVELWECPTHGVYSIPKRGKTMKEVSCNRAEWCGHWCHASAPHQVTEQCERGYCLEVRRQVRCTPVEESQAERWDRQMRESAVPAEAFARVTTPPETCSRRVLGICDLSGMPCDIVYDGVTCRRGRPPSAAEVAEADVEEHRYEDARQVWAEIPAEGTRWQTKDDRGNPLLLQWRKGSWVKVETPATMTPPVSAFSISVPIERDVALRLKANSDFRMAGARAIMARYYFEQVLGQAQRKADDGDALSAALTKGTVTLEEPISATMTASVYESNVHAILTSALRGIVDWQHRADVVNRATARIMKLPREAMAPGDIQSLCDAATTVGYDEGFEKGRAEADADLLKHAAEVMDTLEEYGPSIVPHLMDNDNNAGEQLRQAIARIRQEGGTEQ